MVHIWFKMVMHVLCGYLITCVTALFFFNRVMPFGKVQLSQYTVFKNQRMHYCISPCPFRDLTYHRLSGTFKIGDVPRQEMNVKMMTSYFSLLKTSNDFFLLSGFRSGLFSYSSEHMHLYCHPAEIRLQIDNKNKLKNNCQE